ncbi:MAG: hypothetical protein RLY86_2502 [Pseudomonadota bacterium]|jgi:NitT/TauT family transport system ATP-binding protein
MPDPIPDTAPAPDAKPLLTLHDVGLVWPGGVRALDSVTLTLARGEFVSLLGPSGCGKSTLLRLVAGLLAPSSGLVAWDSTPRPGGIGVVFQDPTLMPWARIAANVRLPLDLAGTPRAEADRRVAALLERVGLRDFARAYPRELSGGMRMRAALARALVTDPAVLLLDEPFAALDEITRFKLSDDLHQLWQDTGFTALFVTHSVFEAAWLSTRVAVMAPRPGRILTDRAIDLPRRRSRDLRTDPAYAALCRSLSADLERAMGGMVENGMGGAAA